MPYPTPYEVQEAKKGLAIIIAIVVMIVMTVVLSLWQYGCSAKETSDYAGPDGTLTGVPHSLRNYVVEDHDTGVYYFLILDPNTDNVTICPRFNADGTLWRNPLHEEAE